MDLYRIAILSNKLRQSMPELTKPNDVYFKLKNNDFIKVLIKDNRLSGRDLVYLIFLISLQNKGMKGDDILRLLDNFLFGFMLVEITQDEPDVECEYCSGNGQIECDTCYGSGNNDCSECDNTGEVNCDECGGMGRVDCDECGGTGEDEEGETCSDCDGDGYLNCPECHGKGTEGCSWCDGDGEVSCNNCDGSGHEDCHECDGSGEITEDGKNEFIEYNFLSLNNKIRDRLIDFESGNKINEEFYGSLYKDEFTLLCSESTEISDEFYDSVDVGDYVFSTMSENPSISANNQSVINLFY